MYIKKSVSKWKSHTCICGRHEECKQVVNLFRELDDYRGQYKKVPNMKQNSKNEKQRQLCEFWDKRLTAHLRVNRQDIRQNQSFNRNSPERPASRNTPSPKKTRDAYIAMWHYHPKISRIAKGKISGILKREWFHHFEYLLAWGHGRANLVYGYLQMIESQ